MAALLLLWIPAPAQAGAWLAEWLPPQSGSGGILLRDKTGGFDFIIPSNASVAEDVEATGKKYLTFDGESKLEIRAKRNLPELAAVHLKVRVKPVNEEKSRGFQYGIIGGARWELRYNASRKSFVVNVVSLEEGKAWFEVEVGAHMNVWNDVEVTISGKTITLKVGGAENIRKVEGPGFTPFEAGILRLARPYKGEASFAGSIADMALGDQL